MLEFVVSGLYFVQDKNNFINPDLMKKVPDTNPDPAGQK